MIKRIFEIFNPQSQEVRNTNTETRLQKSLKDSLQLFLKSNTLHQDEVKLLYDLILEHEIRLQDKISQFGLNFPLYTFFRNRNQENTDQRFIYTRNRFNIPFRRFEELPIQIYIDPLQPFTGLQSFRRPSEKKVTNLISFLLHLSTQAPSTEDIDETFRYICVQNYLIQEAIRISQEYPEYKNTEEFSSAQILFEERLNILKETKYDHLSAA